MSDDPAVWLVEEFGAESFYFDGKLQSRSIKATDRDCNLLNLDLVTYWDITGWWYILDQRTSESLTRDDVRRLCEIFGVEVKQ